MRDFARWCNRNRDWMIPSVVLLLTVVLLISLSGVVNDLHWVIDSQHQSNLDFCHRSNESRKASIRNYRNDVRNLKGDRRFLVTSLPPSAERDALVATKDQAIAAKRQAIRSSIAAQAPVAIHPGSPVANCHKAYP